MGFGFFEGASLEHSSDKGGIQFPEYPGGVLRLDFEDLTSLTLCPCLGGKQDFGKLGHFVCLGFGTKAENLESGIPILLAVGSDLDHTDS